MRGRNEAIRTLSALRARQKPLILCSLRPEIESMLRALRLETLMTIVATRDDAEALVARSGA